MRKFESDEYQHEPDNKDFGDKEWLVCKHLGMDNAIGGRRRREGDAKAIKESAAVICQYHRG